MTFSAIIRADQADAANAVLEAGGFGPGNFSIPLRAGSGPADRAGTHVGMQCIARRPAFRAAVGALESQPATNTCEITDGALLQVTFGAQVAAKSLDWSDPTLWFQNPVMIGDRRTYNGKEWESLVDYNVWGPPVGWREVVAEGYPAWVQPTGAHDAYTLGFRVTHLGQNWQSDFVANVWEPGVFGWSVLP